MGLWTRLVGESKRDTWSRLAEELGGTFQPGGFLGVDKVVARVHGWDVVLDTFYVSTGKSTVVYTRVHAPLVNPRRLRMKLVRASILSRIAKVFGQQDIEVGDATFDRDWILQANDEDRLRALLADDAVKSAVGAQARGRFELGTDGGYLRGHYHGTLDVFSYIVMGVVRDLPRLRALFALFGRVLQTLRTEDALDVPPAELAQAFESVVHGLVDCWGGDCARVGDTIEARLGDPQSDEVARLIARVPTAPAFMTSLVLDAPLPPGPAFTVEKRGLINVGALPVPALHPDLAARGDRAAIAHVDAAAAALNSLARVIWPHLQVDERMHLETDAHPVTRAAPAVLAAVEVWDAIRQARSGVAASQGALGPG